MCSASTYAQISTKPREKKYYHEILEEIFSCNEPHYSVNNLDIYFNKESSDYCDSIFQIKQTVNCALSFGSLWNETNLGFIIEENALSRIKGTIWFMNVTFKKMVDFNNVPIINDFQFFDCNFEGPLLINLPKLTYASVLISNSNFNNTLQVSMSEVNEGYLAMEKCTLDNRLIEVKKCDSWFFGSTGIKLELYNNVFTSSDLNKTFVGIGGAFNSVTIDNCVFNESLLMNQLEIVNKCHLAENYFSNISIDALILPPSSSTYIGWKSLEGKIVSFESQRGDEFPKGFPYATSERGPLYLAKSDEELKNEEKYHNLISTHYILLQMYKSQGDFDAANGCFVEVKDIQSRKFRYKYKTNPNISNFFIWRTNQFLRYFSDYGTNPAKSVIVSFYVILIFGCFYFFFYSAWDKINKMYFMSRFYKLSQYLASKTTLEEFYNTSNKREIGSLEQFKSELKTKKVELPIYVIYLGHFFYRYSNSKHSVGRWVLKRFDIQKGVWKELKAGKKILVGTTIGITITVFLIYTLLIKAISASMLSLNAFSTLGFGNIPVKGLSKYLTVIEGFLGWLLLSIFSVSLVAQIIF